MPLAQAFGPNSVESEDMYLRLDKDLGDFLRFLDKQVGKGNYLDFLSVSRAFAPDDLSTTTLNNELKTALANGDYPLRIGDIS